MAQAATMGPPMSPRETRRSGRRSAPAAPNTSKSPDSDPPPRSKELSHRPALSTASITSRSKRLKQEDIEETVDDRKRAPTPSSTSNGSNHNTANSRTKRKPKDKDRKFSTVDTTIEVNSNSTEDVPVDGQEEEEQGITRCICGSTEDDPDAGEFMVQCETCKVWQHGLCMGYESEDQLHDDDYYCEQCRPMLHAELLKKFNKKPRHPSATSHLGTGPISSRASRSHSPSHVVKQPSKRRNTMNSRDFDESLKEVMEATAAEAAAAQDVGGLTNQPNGINHQEPEEDPEGGPSNRKKRKRTEEEQMSKKRTRSASTVSDLPPGNRDETPTLTTTTKPLATLPAPPPKQPARKPRGGRKAAESLPADSEEVPKRHTNGTRVKGSAAPKRLPASHIATHGIGVQESGTRRNQVVGSLNGPTSGMTSAEASRAYKNSHAYVVSQQPLFTSWGLPDYLSHLGGLLPTEVPKPLEILSGPGVSGNTSTGRDSVERTVERGVKVKWPSKRMSVGDMNKRVRALLEWVGREQVSALDRRRRRCELEKSLREEAKQTLGKQLQRAAIIGDTDGDISMVVDREPIELSPLQEKALEEGTAEGQTRDIKGTQTMKLMEELMEELISFQEKFGPGAKHRDRDRRTGVNT